MEWIASHVPCTEWCYSEARRQWESPDGGVITDEQIADNPCLHPNYVEPRVTTTADIIGFEIDSDARYVNRLSAEDYYHLADSIRRARRDPR